MNTSAITPRITNNNLMKPRITPAHVLGTRKRILLVDADAASQARRAGMLRQRGVEVVCADDMEHGQLLWEADTYNLVIVDATNAYDRALAFHQSIKAERPNQLVTFLVGRPVFLADSPVQAETPAGSGKISGLKSAHTLLTAASDRFRRGTGIMNAASQMSTRRAILRLQSADNTIERARKETSFGEAVRRAGGGGE